MLDTILPSGLRVLVEENHASKVVALQVWVRVGSADERPEEAGLAHVHEHMLFKGTDTRKVGEIASTVEGAGGDINAWTSYDQTVYHITMASRDFAVGLDILADAVQHSAFDPNELQKELEVVLEEVRRGNDMPQRVVSENLFKTAYRVHPYARPVIGTMASVKSFTRDMILAFYRKWYRPENMCLVVVGDVRADDVLRRATELFPKAKGAELGSAPSRTVEPTQSELRVVCGASPIAETQLTIAWHATGLTHPDTPALDVLSVLLGSGESSRLQRVLKREAALVNDAYAYAYTPADPGLVGVGATLVGDRVEDAFLALVRETMRLRYEEPTRAEVDKARTILLSDAVYQKETVQGVARKVGFYALMTGNPEHEELYYSKVREIQPADVLAAARKYLTYDAPTVSVLLPEQHKGALDEAKIAQGISKVRQELEAQYHPPTLEAGREQIVKTRLQNGATLLVREDHAVPLVSVRAQAKGGLLAETETNAGISHLLASLLTRGTRRYSATQIAELSDATASSLGGAAGRNSIGLRGDFLKEYWTQGFDLFTSCLLESTFEKNELERERELQLEEVEARQDHLSAVCFDQLAAAMWKSHPYRLPLIGTRETVSRLDGTMIAGEFEKQLRPDRLVISVVGAVDVADVVDRFERRVGCVHPPPNAPGFSMPTLEAAASETKSVKVARPKEQAHVALGFWGLDIHDTRRYALEVLTSVLGGQGGRLFLELRDRQSLCYTVSAFSVEGLHPGYFAVYMGTAPDKLATAEEGLRRELTRVVDDWISMEELDRAKRYLVGAHEIGLQRASARASIIGLAELYGLGYDDFARYAGRIESVTREDVRHVAADVIRLDRVVRSVVDVETRP